MCPDPFHKIVITFSPFSPSFTPQSFANCCSQQLAFILSLQAVFSQNLQTVHKSNNFTNFPWFQTIFLLYLQIVISNNCFACTCSRQLSAIIQIVVWSAFLQVVRPGTSRSESSFNKVCSRQPFCKLLFGQLFCELSVLELVLPDQVLTKSRSRHPFCKA